MKKIFPIILLLKSLIAFSAPPEALFSPYEGKEAFDRIYKTIMTAKETAHISIYSWSDAGVTKAMQMLLENNPGVKLRVVLHRPLARKETTLVKVAQLEKLGAMFKMAKSNMHEKFVIADSTRLINSSANMSGGAKNRYSEDFVFIKTDGERDLDDIIAKFEREFAILWNSADDIVSPGELQKADVLTLDLKKPNLPDTETPIAFYSSSMNFLLSPYSKSSKSYQNGRTVKMTRRKLENDEDPYVVSTALIEAIDNAKDTIQLSLNHFNLYSVSQALIRAVKRGVKIRLAVDNQEFKTRIVDEGKRPTIEMTPRFIRDWKKLPGNSTKEPPVRVKYYSMSPHHSSWLLNHHKYILIDVNGSNPVLFAGSFNLSKNAELNQFDSLVAFKGKRYSSVHKEYAQNHNRIWMMNRTQKDMPSKAAIDYFRKVYEGSYIRLHAQSPRNAVSLTWSEALKLKDQMGQIAPGVYSNLYRRSGCLYYNFKTKSYFGGRSCQ